MSILPESAQRERNCYLTTSGRVTGNPHEIEIWFAAAPQSSNTLYLLSGGRDRSDWVRNVRANPAVTLRIGTTRYTGAARIIAPDEPLDLVAREIVASKYQSWRPGQPFSSWARESLPVTIVLEGVAP